MKPAIFWLAAGLTACTGSAADHERLGDAAYGRERYEEALAEYEAAAHGVTSASLQAKLGLTAVHMRNYREAALSYRNLAARDPSRTEEAVSGLERVAREADKAGDTPALRDAITALRIIAPDRSAGRYALGLARRGGLAAPEAVTILPSAIAAAPDAGTVDSLLGQYAEALRETNACASATRIYRATLRRSSDSKLRAVLADGLAACAAQLGREAMAVNKADSAAYWFGEAVRADSTSEAGRQALVSLGDVRVAQGDILGAAMAYQAAITGAVESDTISQLAAHKLNALGSPQDGADSLKARSQ